MRSKHLWGLVDYIAKPDDTSTIPGWVALAMLDDLRYLERVAGISSAHPQPVEKVPVPDGRPPSAASLQEDVQADAVATDEMRDLRRRVTELEEANRRLRLALPDTKEQRSIKECSRIALLDSYYKGDANHIVDKWLKRLDNHLSMLQRG